MIAKDNYTLKPAAEPGIRTIYLSEDLAGEIQLALPQTVMVKIGGESFPGVTVRSCAQAEGLVIYLSPDIWQFSYQGQSLRVISGKNSLVIGPAVGLTITQGNWKDISKSGVLLARAKAAAKRGIILYCFPLDEVNWDTDQIEAWFLKGTGGWSKAVVHVPRIIHDRGSAPGPRTVASWVSRGKVSDLLWLNSTRTLAKWETYLAMANNCRAKVHTPETSLLSIDSIKEFMAKFRYNYVKASFGRNGSKVVRIEQGRKGFLCKAGGSNVKGQEFSSAVRLLKHLQTTLGGPLIIQQGLQFDQVNGKNFDMRVLVQKDKENRWVVSGLNHRFAAPGAVVNNYAAGASTVFVAPGDDLMHPQLSWPKLDAFARGIASALEDYFGSLGEVGLDVGLDKDGKLWLIEANSRPSSKAYSAFASPKDKDRIYGMPWEYCWYLSQLQLPN